MKEHPLPSWNDSPAKRMILDFIDQVTQEKSTGYVPPEERVAVFDNDGTLWCEKPMPIQADFFFLKIGEMAKDDPSLRGTQPWKAVFEKDTRWLSDVITQHYHGDDRNLKIMAGGILKAYGGLTVEEYETQATAFLKTARNPVLKRPYLECAYQPMIELLKLLESAGFTNYIASGGGRDFMRPITKDLYGISLERVIGSSVALRYEDDGVTAKITHQPDVDIFDDGPAKPVRIWSRIGQRPIFAAGNSNGDIPMLRFCSHPSRPSLSLLIDHDDDQREFAYQAGAEESLRLARQHGWAVASMKNDWKEVFAAQAQRTGKAA